MGTKYSFKGYNEEHMARAYGRDLPISTKQSIEICNFIRRLELVKAQQLLEEVIKEKKPVPFKRFTNGLGHKKGIGAGRYPKKASINILKLLKSAEVNAQQKGLNTGSLVIKYICANKASGVVRPGRRRGREMKRTHVEIVVEEKAKKAAPKKEEPKKPEAKKEVKPAEKKEPAKEEKPAEKKEAKPAAKVSEPIKEKKEIKEEVKAEKKEEPKKEDKPKEIKKAETKPKEAKKEK